MQQLCFCVRLGFLFITIFRESFIILPLPNDLDNPQNKTFLQHNFFKYFPTLRAILKFLQRKSFSEQAHLFPKKNPIDRYNFEKSPPLANGDGLAPTSPFSKIFTIDIFFSYAIHDEYRQKLRETIPYLGEWLTSSDFDVKKLTTTALFKLSCNRDNSLLIYEKGAVKVCLGNILQLQITSMSCYLALSIF